MTAGTDHPRKAAWGQSILAGGALGAGLVMLAALGPLFGSLPPGLEAGAAPAPPSTGTVETRRITLEEYDRIVEGMSYAEVARLVGDGGDRGRTATVDGATAVAYGWPNDDGSQATVIFYEGRMAFKTQAGL